jgi:uncharacterized protein (TIGR03118 family)
MDLFTHLPRLPLRRRFRPCLESLEERRLMANNFLQTNLVSDIAGLAVTQDPHLVNPWGLTASSTSAAWVANNNNGTSTLYDGQGNIIPLVVTIPTNTPGVVGSPSGTVFNPLSAIKPLPAQAFNVSENVGGVTKIGASIFLFATEDGLITGWSPGVDRTHAITAVTNNQAGYKGLTTATDANGDTLLYAANIAQGTIDVFDPSFKLVQGAPGSSAAASSIHLTGNFSDPSLPTGYAPFNVQNIGNNLYVEYAKYDPTTTEGAPGAGQGFVDVYSSDGVLLTPHHLISGGALNAPWGVALAPSNFGSFSNDLLVGNFGDGRINAFDPVHGTFLGPLTLPTGKPFQEDDLWALRFGNGAGSGASNTLFFTAGINDEKDGLYGSLQALTPAPVDHQPLLTNLGGAALQTISTVPANGDQNPYGVAYVPKGFPSGGQLNPGDLLISNFNNAGTTANPGGIQGTGTTIERITPDGGRSTFFQGSPGLGLTTALGVLKSGFVIVGNVPTDSNGNAQQGSLLILDSNGHLVNTLSDSNLLDGPWDLAVNDHGDNAQVFVSNVLSGTVSRIDLHIPDGGKPIVESITQIASGYAFRTDPNALVVGPTGLAFDAQRNVLYVAATADNAIFAIHDAANTHHDHGTGQLVVQNDPHLHGPLGLVLAPNGDLIAANGDAVNPDPNNLNELVEFTTHGKFVGQFQVDPGGPGGAFGLAIGTNIDGTLRLAAVDDNTNTIHVFAFQRSGDDHGDAHAARDAVFSTMAPPSSGHHHRAHNHHHSH